MHAEEREEKKCRARDLPEKPANAALVVAYVLLVAVVVLTKL